VWLAVVSQPCSRSAAIAAPGRIDKSLGEFWVENPWEIVKGGHNLSAFERNRTWLNVRGGAFVDLSYLTGMDSEGDGRCAVAGDFQNNGRLDVVVRQAGGGALLFFANQFPQRHYLKVTLRGKQSNRQGIGARLTATVGRQKYVRELYPINSYRSQAPNVVHFGLGDATKMDHLTVRWPSGKMQQLSGVSANSHVVIDEDREGYTVVVAGQVIEP